MGRAAATRAPPQKRAGLCRKALQEACSEGLRTVASRQSSPRQLWTHLRGDQTLWPPGWCPMNALDWPTKNGLAYGQLFQGVWTTSHVQGCPANGTRQKQISGRSCGLLAPVFGSSLIPRWWPWPGHVFRQRVMKTWLLKGCPWGHSLENSLRGLEGCLKAGHATVLQKNAPPGSGDWHCRQAS